MADTREETLRRFFQQYAQASLGGDADRIAAAYAPTYIESSPDSFTAWTVDETYRNTLRERHVLMRDHLGLDGLDVAVLSIEEVAPRHYVVSADWKMRFTKAKAGRVTSGFKTTYVVKIQNKPEILAHLAHESEEAVLRRDGVI